MKTENFKIRIGKKAESEARRKFLFVAALLLPLFFFSAPAKAAEITPKVSIEKVFAHARADNLDGFEAEVVDGRLLPKKEIYPGQRVVQIIGAEYELEFYNVGEMGKGKLPLWRPEHAEAKLTVRYLVNRGRVAVEKKLPPELVHAGDSPTVVQYDPADDVPEIAPVEYKFRFSGGPDGVFRELPPYRMGEKGPAAQAEVVGGKEVRFGLLDDRPVQGAYFLLPHHRYMPPLEIRGEPFADFSRENVCGLSPETFSRVKTESFSVKAVFAETAFARDSGARFNDLSGQVEVYPISDPEDSRIARMDDILKVGEAVHTEEDSSAVISFADMTTFVLCPESTIVFDTPPERKSKISIIGGKIWANIKRMAKDGSMDITMNQAVAGIKGTTLVLEDDGKTSILKVIEGEVEYRAKSGGDPVTVVAGEELTATAEGLGEKKKFDAVTVGKRWEDLRSALAAGSEKKSDKSSFPRIEAALVSVAAVILVWLVYRRKKRQRNRPSE